MKLDDLKKLSSEQRIRFLKEFEQEKKKEIQEAQKLVVQTEKEMDEEEEIRRNVPIPQVKAVSIDSLFSREEKQVFATKRFSDETEEELPAEPGQPEARLEAKLRDGGKGSEDEEQYLLKMAQKPTVEFYSRAMYVYHEARREREERGYLSDKTRNEIRSLYFEQRERERAQKEGVYNIPSAMEGKFNLARGWVENLMEWYRT
jgi:hypothetical protein